MLVKKLNLCNFSKFNLRKSITFKQAFLIVICLHVVGFIGLTQISSYRAKLAKENAARKKLLDQEKLPQLWNNEGVSARVVAVPKPTNKPKAKEESKLLANILQKYDALTNSLHKSWASLNTSFEPKRLHAKLVNVIDNESSTKKLSSSSSVPKQQPKKQTAQKTPKRRPSTANREIKNYNPAPPPRPKQLVVIPSMLDSVKIDQSTTVYEPQTWVAENGEVLTLTTSRKTTTYIIPQ